MKIPVTDEQILEKFYDLVDRKLNDAGVVAELRTLFARPATAPACRCATLDEDLWPCEPCWERLSPEERARRTWAPAARERSTTAALQRSRLESTP